MFALQRIPVGLGAARSWFAQVAHRVAISFRSLVEARSGRAGRALGRLAEIERELGFLDPDMDFLACYRGEIEQAECIAVLDKKLRHIRILQKNLDKASKQGDLTSGYHDELKQVLASKEQSILRQVNWIECGGMIQRTMPKAGTAGSQARFAISEPNGEIRWIGLLNWRFDGLQLCGYDHRRSRPATIPAMQIVTWSDMSAASARSSRDLI